MKAYYNEHDPKAAAWLRELMRAGVIMDGVVDERSIAEVRPADLVGFARVHFFAGIGGWDYALKLAGWPADRPIWTGSCPCQPFSAAGRGRGHEDARHLWPEFQRLIAECRPPVVLGEQVASRLGRTWLAAVRADLEELGYGVGAADLCAAGVGAPHIRQRLYWVADHDGPRCGARGAGQAGDGRDAAWVEPSGLCPTDGLADADQSGRGQLGGVELLDGLGAPRGDDADGRGAVQRLADAVRSGWAEGRAGSGKRPAPGGGESGGLADADEGQRGRLSDGKGRECDRKATGREQGYGKSESGGESGGVADAHGERRRLGEPGRGDADDASGTGEAHPWADLAWLPCRDGKARPTQPGLFPLAHGGPGRVGLLRGAGNAIVPQAAAAFIEAYRCVRAA